MNERIKQLWEDNDTIEVCYPEQGSPVSVSATTLEKFAELIVRECLAQVARVDDMLEDEPAQTAAVAWVASSIAQHFGVEE